MIMKPPEGMAERHAEAWENVLEFVEKLGCDDQIELLRITKHLEEHGRTPDDTQHWYAYAIAKLAAIGMAEALARLTEREERDGRAT